MHPAVGFSTNCMCSGIGFDGEHSILFWRDGWVLAVRLGNLGEMRSSECCDCRWLYFFFSLQLWLFFDVVV